MRGGYLHERAPNTWRLEFSVDGQRDSVTVSAKGRKAAWAAAQKARDARLASRPAAPADWTVADFLQAWLRDKLPSCRTPNTRRNYQRHATLWLRELGSIKVHDTQAVMLAILTVKGRLLNEDKAPSTVIGILDTIKQASKWGCKLGLLVKDPAAAVDLPPLVTKRPRAAYSLEEALLLDAVLVPPYGAAVALGLWAGCRMGEAIAVRIKRDLDFAGRVVRIEEQLQQVTGEGMQFAPPKQGQRRTVQMASALELHLRAQLIWNRETQLERKGAWRGKVDDLLTTTVWGTRVTEETVRKYLRTACAEAGVVYHDFHTLRHTYATLMRRAHVSDADIAPSLGHRNTVMLAKLYGDHPDQNRHERMAKSLDAYIASAPADPNEEGIETA